MEALPRVGADLSTRKLDEESVEDVLLALQPPLEVARRDR
jgi:hypothetical protein